MIRSSLVKIPEGDEQRLTAAESQVAVPPAVSPERSMAQPAPPPNAWTTPTPTTPTAPKRTAPQGGRLKSIED